MGTIRYAIRRWSRAEYDHLIEHGVFKPDERLELIGGDLVVREPQSGPHALAVELASDALRAALGPGWRVRVQLPVALGDDSEPEPDLSIVPGTPREAGVAMPSRPVLIVEIAQSSLAFDRADKASVYARAGIQDLWIVNLVNRLVEVHREPMRADDAPYGWRYRLVRSLGPGETITPLAASRARIAVEDLLP